MPCPSWSISAKRCVLGSELRKQADTVCSKCYAHKGHFVMGPVHKANEQRLLAFYAVEDWHVYMARYIELLVPIGDPHFRWFSSGDLQSATMLTTIFKVCELTPTVRHWLPTQERGFVEQALRMADKPDNLVIRISGPMINGVPPLADNTSVVVGPVSKEAWTKRVAANTHTRFHCEASAGDDYACGTCRACWDSTVETVVYKLH